MKVILSNLLTVHNGYQEILDTLKYDLIFYFFKMASNHNIRDIRLYENMRLYEITKIYYKIDTIGILIWDLPIKKLSIKNNCSGFECGIRGRSLYIN